MRRTILYLLIIVAAALYLTQIGAAPLWYDEAGTAWMSELPLPRLVAATAGDTHPPLYFLLEAGVQHTLGNQPWALRLPSAICALIAFYLAWLIARELGLSHTAQMFGLGLMVLSAFQLHFAQEARMYALFQVEVLGLLLAVLHRRWWFAGLVLAAALYTHNYALIYVPVIGALALLQEMERPVIVSKTFPGKWLVADNAQPGHVVIAFSAPLALFVPWAFVLRQQMSAVAGGYWIMPITPGSVIYVLYTWLFSFTLTKWLQPTGVLVAVGVIAWLTIRTLRSRERRALVLGWVVLAPLTLAVIASIVWKPILLFRGLAPSAPLLFLWIGWALDHVARPRRLYALILLVPLLVAAILGHYRWNPEQKDGAQRYAAAIRAQWQAGDVMIDANTGTLLELHHQMSDLPQYLMPRCAQSDLGELSQATRDAMGIVEADPESLTWQRIWFVWSWAPTVTQCEVDRARAFLAAHPHSLVFPIRNDKYVQANIYLVTK